jgi:hypothetical protein
MDIEGEISLWSKQMFLGKEKGRFSPWLVVILGECVDLW